MVLLLANGLGIATLILSVSQEAVSWFPRLPGGDKNFDMGLIRPRDVRSILSKKKLNSSPGSDGIINGHLESTHHFLATLYTKALRHPFSLGGMGVVVHCPHS